MDSHPHLNENTTTPISQLSSSVNPLLKRLLSPSPPPTPNCTTSKPTLLAPPIQRKPPKWPLHANPDSPHKDTSTTTIAQAPQLMLLPRAPLPIQKPLLPRRIGDLVSNFYSWNFYFLFFILLLLLLFFSVGVKLQICLVYMRLSGLFFFEVFGIEASRGWVEEEEIVFFEGEKNG